MKIGISRGCGGSVEGARELLAAGRGVGFEGVQVKTDLLKLFDFDPQRFREAAGELAALAAAGVVYHPSRSPADWPAELPCVTDLATAIGAEHLCICSAVARRQSDDEFADVAEALMQAGAAAQQKGLEFSVHNHADCLFETADDLDRLCANLDPDVCGLTFDTAHADKGGMTDLAAAVRKLRPFITNVHLKDRDEQGSFCPLGRGVMDLRPALDALREIGYDRWLIVDEESRGVGAADACRIAMDYLEAQGFAPSDVGP
jgi:sugar phosphate isomerase/epimerase